jgi:hypothetical protein
LARLIAADWNRPRNLPCLSAFIPLAVRVVADFDRIVALPKFHKLPKLSQDLIKL